MYTQESLKREIIQKGIDNVVIELSSENISEDKKAEMNRVGIFVDGYPNLSLLYSLS